MCENMRKFALRVFVYVNPSTATSKAASIIQQVLSGDEDLCDISDLKMKEVDSLGRLRIDFNFPAANPSAADEKADKIIQTLMKQIKSKTEEVHEGSNLLSYA